MISQRMLCTHYCLTILSLLAVMLAGCIQPASPANSDSNVEIILSVEPDPPIMGESELIVMLKDADGAPIPNAEVEVQGDMSHAGMAPVIRAMGETEAGIYHAPFEWTMGGDWFVTVTAKLVDDQEIEKIFEFSVGTGE